MRFYVIIHTKNGDLEQRMESDCYSDLEVVLKVALSHTPYSVYSALPKSYKTLVAQSNGGNNE